jgi:uncharacterized repeat protein (TIGR03803 family)
MWREAKMKSKAFRSKAALILTTLMLLVAAATTVAIAQTYTDLYNFRAHIGKSPLGILAQGRDGNLYGTTFMGGPDCWPLESGCGEVFKITPSGKLKVLYNFGADNPWPIGGLTLGKDGNFYGVTDYGGLSGTIFKTTSTGSLTTLYNGFGGSSPWAPPIQGADGNFYGTTAGGEVYKITSSGDYTSLGAYAPSYAPLFQATDGNFYGTIAWGGKGGSVFKMTPKGILTTVYNFDAKHGSDSEAPVIQASDGNLYGTTRSGGSNGGGVAFKLTLRGAITVLHNFGAGDDGSEPFYAGLVQATDGNFYGVTFKGGTMGYGVIFQITPAGTYSILYNFDGANGGAPNSTPMQHTNGKIYGTANMGAYNQGAVYSFDIGLAPFVKTLPMSGKVGKTVGILGEGLTGTSNVSFNGIPAVFKVWSDTYLRTTVPDGATSGFVTVTTPGGTLTSNKQFTVKP